MKKIGEYTARGKIFDASVEKIRLFDGRFDTGFRVTNVRVWNADPLSGNDGIAMLATEPDATWASAPSLDAGINTQIGWAGFSSGTYLWADNIGILDRDNMVIEDLYIHAQITGNDNFLSYIIEMEKYDITDWQGGLAMVRNRSQT